MDSPELKPCPFCGGTPFLKSGGPGNHFVQCNECRATSDDRVLDSAIAAWNRRTLPPDTQLLHRDENHGPTLERAAERGDAWDSPQALLLAAGEITAQEIRTARAVARGIAAAIRAMEVKHDG